ncbi:MAG: DUF4355 domain-containing protein [Clostridia bacterium]|nr:DUF4355 domain-containing protein [Clostridia bacterium]
MNLEKLKEMLANGTITQEEFDSMKEALEMKDKTKEPDTKGAGKDEEPKNDDMELLIQKAVDRATNKLGNQKKELEKELERIKKEKMTDDERKEYEMQEKERELQEKEREIALRENKLYAISAVKKAGLDDGSETSLDLVEFVIDTDTAKIDSKVKAFSNLVKKLVKAEVDRTFKARGGEPDKGGDDVVTNNPYAKETYNLTAQMQLEISNPELAAKYKALAGVK